MSMQDFLQKLNATVPTEITNMPEVRQRYITNYASMWKERGESEDDTMRRAEAVYNREKTYFNQILGTLIDQIMQKAAKARKQPNAMDRFSIFNAFIESSITNISLEPGVRALAYLTTRQSQMGTQWVDSVRFTVSGYGEMVARIRCGQIRHADNPVVVYDNDELSVRDTDGRKSIEYVCHFPHTNHQIVACYMRITRADGSIDYATMYEEDWKRLEGYSLKQNQRKDSQGNVYGNANALYNANGQIDPGFLQAKLIKHAFKTYPKVRIGSMAILSEEDDDANNILQHDEQYANAPWEEQPSGESLGTMGNPFAAAPEPEQAPTYQAQVTSANGGVQMQSNDDIF